jgi:hypothetical protein
MDVNDSTVNDTSNNPFAIKGGIEVSQPNGGDSWLRGTPQQIKWKPQGTYPSSVLIQYYNGTAWKGNYSASAGTDNTTQTYNLTVPDDLTSDALVRVSTQENNASIDVNDSSNSTFNITGNLTLNIPDGTGIIWYVNDTNRQISWDAIGTVTPVLIELSTNNGSTWDYTINASYSGVAGSNTYNWTPIPDLKSELCKIRISHNHSVFSSTVTDNSTNPFAIRPIIDVTQPATGANVKAQSTDTPIRWTYSGTKISTVNIEYSTNGGVNWTTIESGVSVADGSNYTWPSVPVLTTSSALVRVKDSTNEAINDTSGVFNIVGWVRVTSPDGGQHLKAGNTYPVTWAYLLTNFVNISYSLDNGSNWTVIDHTIAAANQSINWTIANNTTVSDLVLLKVADTFIPGGVNDTSNSTNFLEPQFIISAPANNESVTVNRNYTITWKTQGNNSKVNIYWSLEGEDWQIINNGTAVNVTDSGSSGQTGTYVWNAPDYLTNNTTATARINITYPTRELTVYNHSNQFRTVAGFTVFAPDTDNWKVNTTRQIIWNCTSAKVPAVNLTFAVDGTNYNTTINSSANNTGTAHTNRTYDWKVSDNISTGFRVKVRDSNRSVDYATSANNSSIMGFFDISDPDDGSEDLVVGQAFNITWNCNGSVPAVKLELYKYDAEGNLSGITPIINSTANSGINGTYQWTVNDTISHYLKVRISDVNYSNDSYNFSENNFTIRGAFNVLLPEGGDRFNVSANETIRWNTTGSITRFKIIAYSTDPGEPIFRYNLTNYYPIEEDYTNNGAGNNQTNYTWVNIPNMTTDHAKIRIIDFNDNATWAESSENFSIIGSYNLNFPSSVNQSYVVGEDRNITWSYSGPMITAKIAYSTNGTGGPWSIINETWNNSYNNTTNTTPPDGIVANNGSYLWQIPDNITTAYTVYLNISDPDDPTVYSVSPYGFKIRGNFSISSPENGSRWVTYETNRSISWATNGTIPRVNLYYYKDNNLSTKTVITNATGVNATNITNNNTYTWYIPDDRNNTVRVILEDVNDTSIYVISDPFKIDYYNISWVIKDFLSGLAIGSGLNVSDTSGWTAVNLSSSTPILHATPYGNWNATWTQPDYGTKVKAYTANSDKNLTVYLESLIVHIWEARTDYVYTPGSDRLNFNSYLLRDGSMAGARNETTGVFSTIAKNCTIEIYDPSNTTLIKSLYTDNVTTTGFFSINWTNITNATPIPLNTSVVYNAITQIVTAYEEEGEEQVGGTFRTPFLINVVPTMSLYEMSTTIADKIDVPLSLFESNVTTILGTQTVTITGILNNQTGIIENKTTAMSNTMNKTLSDFENRTYAAIDDLQSGANATQEAAANASAAAAELEATAKKYSWSASVAPNPALLGDNITITCQGQPDLLPILNIYTWDNVNVIMDQFMTETTAGVYTYTFQAASTVFTPGKPYTYVITESVVTYGMVTGSGVIESMSITTVAGLASAAPGAERAAKKALEAIKAVEAVLVSGDNINIALTLKNLKDSVEALPEILSKEGAGTGTISEAVNEIAEKLKALGLEEGYDFSELIEKALGDSPAIKEVRSKTEAISGIVELLLKIFEAKFGGLDTPIVATTLLPGSVRFRVVAVNPSKVRTQTIQVKTYLPGEVTPKDITDLGGLELEYDSEKSIYYVYKQNLELAPSEVRAFEVEVSDVWITPEKELEELKRWTDSIITRLEKTEYYPLAREKADSIYKRLNGIATSQADENVSRAQHIGIYRENLSTIAEIKEDIARLEKILATAGGPLAPDMLAKAKIKSESPSKTMTWIVIFTLVIFVGLLAGVLFFTWHRQSRFTREELLAAKESAFPGPSEDQEPKNAEQPPENP